MMPGFKHAVARLLPVWQGRAVEHERNIKLRIRQAAFALAERKPWHEIDLSSIALMAGVGLPDMLRIGATKAAILTEFDRDIDEAVLVLFNKYPPVGEPHDRLFDVMLKRLEIMQPYRRVIESAMKRPFQDPGEAMERTMSLTQSIGWMVVAAGYESSGGQAMLGRIALARAYLHTLKVWVRDDDPGLARTMAALDRALHDWDWFGKRTGAVITIAGGLMKAAQVFLTRLAEQRKRP